MSNLLVQNIKHTNNTTAATVSSSGGVAVAGTLAVTGVHTVGNNAVYTSDGGAVTQNLVQGLIKAWCKFNGEAGSIANDDSFNVSGLTDNGTGDYTVAINNDMANDDYAITCNGSEQVFSIYNISNTHAGTVRVYSQHQDSSTDAQEASVQITGDLA